MPLRKRFPGSLSDWEVMCMCTVIVQVAVESGTGCSIRYLIANFVDNIFCQQQHFLSNIMIFQGLNKFTSAKKFTKSGDSFDQKSTVSQSAISDFSRMMKFPAVIAPSRFGSLENHVIKNRTTFNLFLLRMMPRIHLPIIQV